MSDNKGGVIRGKKKEIKVVPKIVREPLFIGMDPSYNGFAIILLNTKGEMIEQRLLKTDSKKEAEERIIELESGFDFIPNVLALHSVYIEGPAYSSQGAFMLQMGALHFYLRVFLFKNKINFKVIAPGTLKKFVAGTGVAKKELMLLKTYKKWGVEFNDNNLCDAYGLARMALEEYKDGEKQEKDI